MTLDRTESYLLPEGDFGGSITDVTMNEDVRNGQVRENLRITIGVDHLPDDPVHDYKARADYWSGQTNTLLQDLYRILGAQVDELMDDDGNLIPSRLSILIGKRVRFSIRHSQRSGHLTAFRKVINLRPEGRGFSLPQPQARRAA